MRIKTLRLKNIRSYRNHEIDFPSGITLFEGDIGSGKTTILMAIEFALFGLGSEKAASLLRMGESKGQVNLVFGVDDQECEVQRVLVKKGKSIQQREGFVKTQNGRLDLTPSEIKEKILEILNFNEPVDPKAQSNIYRYAVFTPQEEMKAILFMKADLRLQTLRKAFRIEDYKTAHDNAQSLAIIVDKKAGEYKAAAFDLETKRDSLETKRKELEQDREDLQNLISRQIKFDDRSNDLKKQEIELRGERDGLSKVQGEIPQLEKQIWDKEKDQDRMNSIIDKTQKKIDDLKPKLEELQQIKHPTDKTMEQLAEELGKFRQLQRECQDSQIVIETKIKDYTSIQEKSICPTCDREADPSEFKSKIDQKINEHGEASKQSQECNSNVEKFEKLIKELEKYNDTQIRIEDLKRQIEELVNALNENIMRTNSLTEEISDLRIRLKDAQKELEEFKEISTRLDELDKDIEKCDKELNISREGVSSKRTKIQEVGRNIDEFINEIAIKEDKIKRSNHLNEHNIWLRDYFIPTIRNIESHVMISLNREFNQIFQRWFSMLIEDSTKNARIDEQFTPIIEQDGYEQDINYLSGGEKTSVALAYRLALNTLVQKVTTTMKSNLLILDEPTDGFSREQLSKIQDILRDLQYQQIIIVSHEKELESFADQVFRVNKIDGESRVSK
jgi:exonuclease SbcC